MSDALDLLKAILFEGSPDDAMALSVLEAALEREVDVLLYCAATLGMGATLVMERAARWSGYAFFERVPEGLSGKAEPTRLEALADVRLFRMQFWTGRWRSPRRTFSASSGCGIAWQTRPTCGSRYASCPSRPCATT